MTITLAIIVSLATGLIAGALYRREKTADAEFLRDEAEASAEWWYRKYQRSLPSDQWHEMGGERVLRAIGLTPVDPDSDRMWSEFDGSRP